VVEDSVALMGVGLVNEKGESRSKGPPILRALQELGELMVGELVCELIPSKLESALVREAQKWTLWIPGWLGQVMQAAQSSSH